MICRKQSYEWCIHQDFGENDSGSAFLIFCGYAACYGYLFEGDSAV